MPTLQTSYSTQLPGQQKLHDRQDLAWWHLSLKKRYVYDGVTAGKDKGCLRRYTTRGQQVLVHVPTNFAATLFVPYWAYSKTQSKANLYFTGTKVCKALVIVHLFQMICTAAGGTYYSLRRRCSALMEQACTGLNYYSVFSALSTENTWPIRAELTMFHLHRLGEVGGVWVVFLPSYLVTKGNSLLRNLLRLDLWYSTISTMS